jgi:hypothetical protein
MNMRFVFFAVFFCLIPLRHRFIGDVRREVGHAGQRGEESPSMDVTSFFHAGSNSSLRMVSVEDWGSTTSI